MKKKELPVKDHVLVPKHAKVSEKEKKQLFSQYTITAKDLPRISVNDPAIVDLDVEPGDIIKVSRKSPTAGEIVFYRGVVDE